MTEFENLVFHHHTSLGDHFICNGIVHYYAEYLCDTLHIPCHQQYFETVECLYKDFDNIVVHPFNDDWATLEKEMLSWAQEKGWPVTRIGFEKVYYRNLQRVNSPKEFFAVNFDRQFYEQANILFKQRYDMFKMPEEVPGSDEVYDKLVGDDSDYIVVHKNSSAESDYPIEMWSWRNGKFNKNIKVVEIQMGQTTNMLAYKKVIENAKEIHCIASSFFCLVDSMAKHIEPKLYYHDIRMNNIMQINCDANNNRWSVIDYPFRK